MAEGSKAKYIRDLLDRALELKVPPDMTVEQFERTFAVRITAEELKNLTFAELLVRQLVIKACSGNDRSIQELLDRLLGKPTQTTESVVKSYSYHDFLISCREADAREVIDIPAPVRAIAAGTVPQIPVGRAGGTPLPPGDPLADLL